VTKLSLKTLYSCKNWIVISAVCIYNYSNHLIAKFMLVLLSAAVKSFKLHNVETVNALFHTILNWCLFPALAIALVIPSALVNIGACHLYVVNDFLFKCEHDFVVNLYK
jgi:hypothetical protein